MKRLFHHFANLAFRRVFKRARQRIRLLAVLNRYVRKRNRFFDQPKECIERGTVGSRGERLLQQRMLPVQPIKHFVMLRHRFP